MDSRPDGAALPVESHRFVIVNQALGPFFEQTARKLTDRGHRVTVLSGDDGTVAIPGVTFVAGPSYDRRSLPVRVRSWLAFLWFVAKTLPDHLANAVLLSASNPPLLPHVCAFVNSKRVPHVTRILDIYPDVVRGYPGVPNSRLVNSIWRTANRAAYRRCTSVVTLGEIMAEKLTPIVSSRPTVIPDWSTIDAASVPARDTNALREDLGINDRLVVLYSGNIGMTHDLGALIRAAERLRGEDRVRFVIVGESARHNELQRAAHSLAVGQLFVFLPRQQADRLPLSMGLGDFSVVTVANGAEDTCMPCKTYDYLAAGSAIIALVGRPSDLAATVDRHQCGIVIDPADDATLAAVIRATLEDGTRLREMRSNARKAARDVFSSEIQCARLVSLLESVASEHQRDDASTSPIKADIRSLRRA